MELVVNSNDISDPVLTSLIFAVRLQNLYALAHTTCETNHLAGSGRQI